MTDLEGSAGADPPGRLDPPTDMTATASSGRRWAACLAAACLAGLLLVPTDGTGAFRASLAPGVPGRLVLALPELAADGSPGVAAVVRFADHIQWQRGDLNGRVLTIRGTDVQTIALAVGTDPEVLVDSLRPRGAVLAG